jgi:hypothetical protein
LPAALYDRALPLAVFNVRVPDDLASRFDAGAAAFGGRSARLRQLIEGDCAGAGAAASGPPKLRDAARLMVRLAAPEAAHVTAQSARLAMPRAGWVAALIRRHARGTPTFGTVDTYALVAVQAELRRIGVNINQIARAMNTAVMEGRVLAAELTSIDNFRQELSAHLTAVREEFAGNLAYWDVEL